MAWTRCSWPCPTERPRTWSPTGERVGLVVDLAADFRLGHGPLPRCGTGRSIANRICWPRRSRVPGCSRTAARRHPGGGRQVLHHGRPLALAPLVRTPALSSHDGIVVDTITGVSGAGRGLKEDDPLLRRRRGHPTPTGCVTHRHTPEIEQAVGGREVVFHASRLAPMNRGILATCYARPTRKTAGAPTPTPWASSSTATAGSPFLVVSARPPSTKASLRSNTPT